MELIPSTQISKELTKELEEALSRLAIAADSGLSTYYLEPEAIKLAKKLKKSFLGYGTDNLYKDVKGSKEYNPEKSLPINLFLRYAKLCKDCGDSLDIVKSEDCYFAQIAENLYISIEELPAVEPIEFKIKIEGNTIMAVRADLFSKLPSATKKLLKGEEDAE